MIECKVLRGTDRQTLAGTVERGVEQTLGYMAQCGAAEGHLVVVDRRPRGRRPVERERYAAVPDERRRDERTVAVWTL